MKRKSDAINCNNLFEKFSENQTGRKVRRSDRGGEYLSDDLTTHFKERGIDRQLITAYTAQQNGVAETFCNI